MISTEQLAEIGSGVCDIIKGILGVKAKGAEIILTPDSKIIFRIDRSLLYVIQTDLFTLPEFAFVQYVETENDLINMKGLVGLDTAIADDLFRHYQWQIKPMNLLVKYDNLHEDQNFLSLTELKSADGLGFYKVFDQNHNMYKIPMFTGFVKFNKGDKVDLEIYDDGAYYINKFTIRKKKINYPVDVYFMTLKLG